MSGFTIIEIMIVLAIAGLILLILFLAIPAVERSARNSGRKHDAAQIGALRVQYDEENGTAIPAPGQVTQGNCSQPYANQSVQLFCTYVTSGMSYYNPANVTFVSQGSPPATVPTVTDPEQILTENYLTCNSSLTQATETGAGPYNMVVLYALESGNGSSQTQCDPFSVFQSA